MKKDKQKYPGYPPGAGPFDPVKALRRVGVEWDKEAEVFRRLSDGSPLRSRPVHITAGGVRIIDWDATLWRLNDELKRKAGR